VFGVAFLVKMAVASSAFDFCELEIRIKERKSENKKQFYLCPI
jgi:hypothetical protein